MIRRSLFRGLSIQQRLPLLICVLLLSIMITFSWISYIGVKKAALNTGKERLRTLTDQLSSMFSQSYQTIMVATHVAAGQESIKKSLEGGGPEFQTDAMQVLQKLRLDSTWVLTELLNANRQPVLHSAKDSIQFSARFDSLWPTLTLNDQGGIGKIYWLKDSMYYPIIVPVTDNKQVIGHLVRWRLIAATPKALEQLSKLIGTEARLYIGNADGSLWTDMIKPVSYQQLDTGHFREPFEYVGKQGKQVIAAARPINNTPWLVSVEFSRNLVLKTANDFLQWIIIAGSILIAVGIFIAWLMSRSITGPLNNLTAASSAIANGDYSATVAVDRKDEIGKLSRAFNTMIGQVSRAREGMEQKIIETSEVNEQLRSLSAYLQNVREDERMHIAREMHDELGQLLTGFKMDVSSLKRKLAETNDTAINEKLDNMSSVIDEAVKFVRKLATELRPSILDDLGLVPALEWHSQEFEKRYSIKIEFLSRVHQLSTSPLLATGLFRMYQESLTNVARHSNADKVKVSLQAINDEIILSITDNGKGFDISQASKKTLGLLGMKERAAMLGGKLEIISEQGKGTTITISVKQELEEKVMVR
ncbi:MAG: sensor histidine kinase [Bacteroidota bacterium]|nr:sensor histidine kinase [Bacteroidota bacterium]